MCLDEYKSLISWLCLKMTSLAYSISLLSHLSEDLQFTKSSKHLKMQLLAHTILEGIVEMTLILRYWHTTWEDISCCMLLVVT